MRYLFLVALLLSVEASAQAYKCVVNGKSVYSDVPCSANARNVSAMHDYVPAEQQLDRARVNSRERRQLGAVETEKAIDNLQHQRMANRVGAEDAAIARQKATRCSSAQRQQKWAERDAALYRDLGMQHSLNQAKREQDTASSRVRDECN